MRSLLNDEAGMIWDWEDDSMGWSEEDWESLMDETPSHSEWSDWLESTYDPDDSYGTERY